VVCEENHILVKDLAVPTACASNRPGPAATGGAAALAGWPRDHSLSAVVLGAALANVSMALGALDRGFLIVKTYAQTNQRNPIEQARTAVETLINRLRGRDMSDGIVKSNLDIGATEADVAAKYPGLLATLTVNEREKPCDALLLALKGGS
jgi:hypothetical protein